MEEILIESSLDIIAMRAAPSTIATQLSFILD